ncbi:MAG TPA: DNA polymerase III subunit gamma/tau [Clostridiales bacterium]|nr:DNA polymerase III subunit gamma/tau [Clostridiales bacterium]
MSYLAIYRRFRPSTFDKMVGQEHVVQTLVNQINSDRIGHAYLFCGARGTGKTSAAKIFARAINCLHPVNGSPCGECEVCKALNDPSNLDILEIDAASNNKVENIREIRDKVQYPPVAAKYKVYIIDEVHMLTTEAFNALLKTLEEPPKHAVFVLATTEPHKLPATILSRCMRFDFRLVPDKTIASLIAGIYDELGKKYDDDAVLAIARAGEGSVRDALSVADLCVSYTSEKLTYNDVIAVLGASDSRVTAKLVENIFKGENGKVLETIDELIDLGKGVGVLNKDVSAHLRDVMVAKTCKNAREILSLPESEFALIEQNAALADVHRILRATEIFAGVENDLKYSTHPRVVFETAAMRASMPEQDYNIDALLARIAKLEKAVAEGIKVTVEKAETTANETKNTGAQAAKSEPITEQKPAPTQPKIEEEPSFARTEAAKPSVEEKPIKVVDDDFYGFAPPEEEDLPFNSTPFTATKKPAPKAEIKAEPVIERKAEPVASRIQVPEIPKPAPAPKAETVQTQTSFFEEKKPEEKPKIVISGARMWGTVVRRLRADKNIMLWIACQDLEAKTDGNKLCIIAEGDNEYNMIKKPENLAILQSIVSETSDYKVVVYHGDEVKETFEDDVKKAEEVLGPIETTD